jgi:hypothetical protein
LQAGLRRVADRGVGIAAQAGGELDAGRIAIDPHQVQRQRFLAQGGEHRIAELALLDVGRGDIGEHLFELLGMREKLGVFRLLRTHRQIRVSLPLALLAIGGHLRVLLRQAGLVVSRGRIGAEQAQCQRNERNGQRRDLVPQVLAARLRFRRAGLA